MLIMMHDAYRHPGNAVMVNSGNASLSFFLQRAKRTADTVVVPTRRNKVSSFARTKMHQRSFSHLQEKQ